MQLGLSKRPTKWTWGDVGYINANNGFMRSSKSARRHYEVRSRVGGLDGAYKG